MNRIAQYLKQIGLVTMLVSSNAVHAVCSFDTDPPGTVAPDGVSDLSGQGNISCANIIGSDGQPMTAVPVVFQRNGDWVLPANERIVDTNGFVTNTPDHVLEFPQGNGSRCKFTYFRNNAVSGTGLSIDGNVDTSDSFACTDGIVNSEEVILPEPDFVTTTGDGCTVTLNATTPNVSVDEDDFVWFTAANQDGSIQAVCNAGGVTQYECVRACPEFKDINTLQDDGYCQSNPAGFIPLFDANLETATGDGRCTPCLTQAQAEATIPGFDTDGLKLCWEYTNNVTETQYRPHKPVRSQTAETNVYNECYETTTTINFRGREITKTVTTCD